MHLGKHMSQMTLNQASIPCLHNLNNFFLSGSKFLLLTFTTQNLEGLYLFIGFDLY